MKSINMNSYNESELMRLMNRSGCLDVATFTNKNCAMFLPYFSIDFGDLPNKQNRSRRIMLAFSTLFHSLAILLNCALLWLLYKDPLKRFRNSPSFLILNLAVADLTGAFIDLIYQNYNPGILLPKILPSFVAATVQCSFITLMFISFHQYIAIVHPLRYRSMVFPKHTTAIIVFSWVASLSVSSLIFFVPQISSHLAGTGFYAVNIFILVAIILTIYPLMHGKFRSQKKQLFSLNLTNQQLHHEKLKTEKNLTNTMLLVSLTLILFLFPYLVTFLFIVTDCSTCILNQHFLNLWMYYRWFLAIHFGINPIIYAWRLPSYRKSLMKLLTSNLTCLQVSDRNHSGPTNT